MIRHYLPSIGYRVLGLELSRLKKKPLAKRNAPSGATPKKKRPRQTLQIADPPVETDLGGFCANRCLSLGIKWSVVATLDNLQE